jgi:hypothetical protein
LALVSFADILASELAGIPLTDQYQIDVALVRALIEREKRTQ